MIKIYNKSLCIAIVVGTMVALPSVAESALLPDPQYADLLASEPDILSPGLVVVYGGGTLSANGLSLNLKTSPGHTELITNGTYALQATVDNAGNLGGGTITIGGTIAALGFNSGTLLTGNLTKFGFDEPAPNSGPLQFLFNVTGGDAASLFGPYGGSTISNILPNFPGNFSQPFTALAQADTQGAVPEASSLAVWGVLGLTGTLFLRRRKRNQS